MPENTENTNIEMTAEEKAATAAPKKQVSVSEALAKAMACYRSRDLAGAETICRRVLALEPKHAEAHHILAIIAHKVGRGADANALARLAVANDANNPIYLNTLGYLSRLNRRYEDSAAALLRAIELRPNYADAYNNLGIVYAERGDLPKAEEAYRDALRHRNEFPEAQNNLGNLLYRMGRLDDAVAAFDAATTLRPGYAEAHASQGDAFTNQGEHDKALEAYRKAVDAAPDSVNAWYKLGNALYQKNEFEPSMLAYRKCVDINPNQPRSLTNLGAALEKLGRIDEAAMILRHAIVLAPDNPTSLKNLGHVVLKLGHVGEGLHLLRRAVELAPEDADAHYTYGNALVRMERLQEALDCYTKVRELTPDAARAYFAPAAVLLMSGRFKQGWDAYESRFGMSTYKTNVSNVKERLWDGSPLNGRRLLVHVEQGFGDTLQFIRYLPLLRQREPAETIKLICEPELIPVLRQVEGYDEIFSLRSDISVEYDVQIPILSLPKRFGTTLETIPNETPYVAPPKDAKARLKRAKGTKLAVGIVWAGRPTHSDDRFRSCPIEWFSNLFNVPGVEFFSLQWGPRAGEISPYLDRKNVTSLSDSLTDFGETAAFIDQLDLVIAIDTAVAHLAGALGKPVWTLLAFGGEWRWLFRREDTPWYPKMRLFRQRILGDWRPVFLRLKNELTKRAAQNDAAPAVNGATDSAVGQHDSATALEPASEDTVGETGTAPKKKAKPATPKGKPSSSSGARATGAKPKRTRRKKRRATPAKPKPDA
jgi:tetratricopeptide (TPR) repeat protein